jgi:hypothetical protein
VRVKQWPEILKWIKETASYVDGGGSIVTLEYLPADPQAAFYTYACAKLGNFLWSGSMPVRRDVLRTLYRCHMQRAAGPLQEAEGVYFRQYSNGLAAVNTTDKDVNARLPAPPGCKELADVLETRKIPVLDGQVELHIPAQAGRLYVTPQQLADGHLREALVALQTVEGPQPGANDSPLRKAVESAQKVRQRLADTGISEGEGSLADLCRNLEECDKAAPGGTLSRRLAEGPRLSREDVRKLVAAEAKEGALGCEATEGSVALTTGQTRWELGKSGEIVRVGGLGVNCGISIQGLHETHGWLAPDKIENAKMLADTTERKVVEITMTISGAKTKETIPDIKFVLTAEARRGENGLRLRSAVRNAGDKGVPCYFTWSTARAGTWCSCPGQPAVRSDKYVNFGKSDWMYVHPSQAGGAGLLVMTDLPQSYGPFACNVYSEPRTGELAPGQERRIDFDLYLVPATWQEDPAAVGAFKRAQVYASKAYSLTADSSAKIRLIGEVIAGRKAQAALSSEAPQKVKAQSASLLSANGDAAIECQAEVRGEAVTFTVPPSLRNDQYLQLLVTYSVKGKDGKDVPLTETLDIRTQPSLSLAGAGERLTWDGKGATVALAITNHLENEAACQLVIEAPAGYKATTPGKTKLAVGEARTVSATITSPQAALPPKGVRALLRFDPQAEGGASGASSTGEQELSLNFVLAMTCPRLPKAPQIDGRLDDDAWKIAATAGPFLLIRDGTAPKEPTEALVGYDDKYLYVGFRCTESQMKALVAKTPRNPQVSNPAVHGDDSVEVFLSPTRDRNYVQLAANSLGAQKMSKPAKWDVAAATGEKGWTVEMRIGLDSLGPLPKSGDVWAVNFCRMEQRLKEASAWSPTERGFHQPDRFGLLTFGH